MLTNKEVNNFISRYAKENIKYYIEKDAVSRSFSATTYCFKSKKDNNKNLYIIALRKDFFKNKKSPKSFLKALLLHEIGHIKMGHFLKYVPYSHAEFEAHMWAISTALKYNLKRVLFFLIHIFLDWKNYRKYKKRLRYYYEAYKKICRILRKQMNKSFKSFRKIYNG